MGGRHVLRLRQPRPRRRAAAAERTGPAALRSWPEFGYLYYGAVWYGDEIWNGGRLREADEDKNGTTDDVELLKWLDANRPGKNDFQPWTKTTHPTLGEVEVGGWNPKFWSQNPPPEMLETWAKNEAMFNLYLAQQLAQVSIVSATAKPAADGAQEITVTVTNEGGIPTALEIAKRVKIVRPDTAVIQLAQGQTFVGGPARRTGRRRRRRVRARRRAWRAGRACHCGDGRASSIVRARLAQARRAENGVMDRPRRRRRDGRHRVDARRRGSADGRR